MLLWLTLQRRTSRLLTLHKWAQLLSQEGSHHLDDVVSWADDVRSQHRETAGDAYIAFPLGPKLLFIAAHDDRYQRHVASIDATRLVKELNQPVVEFAREFVWGFDDGHLRFVCNRMGRSPERPILADKPRQQAIDAALAGAAVSGDSG